MKAVGYPTWLSNLNILLDYNKPGAEFAENVSLICFPLRKRKKKTSIPVE